MRIFIVLVLMLSVCQISLFAQVANAKQQLSENESAQVVSDTVVLLKNGQLLEGYVIRSESKYRIEFSNGAAITVDKNDIELYCESKQAAFEHLHENTSVFDPQEQIALFQWCVRNNMLSQSKSLLRELSSQDIDPSVMKNIELSIKHLERKIELANAPASPANKQDLPEAQVSSGLSTPDLEKYLDELPENVFVNFSNTIQSRLIHGCAAARCHDYRDTVMKMSFYEKGSPVPRRMTQRNLYEVAKWIDKDSPENSQVLKMSLTAHGSADRGTWKKDAANFNELRKWVFQFANKDPNQPKIKPNVVESQTPVGSNATEHTTMLTGPLVDPQSFSNEDAIPLAAKQEELVRPPSPINPLENREFKPLDPFDPEIFNRIFRLAAHQKELNPAVAGGEIEDASKIPAESDSPPMFQSEFRIPSPPKDQSDKPLKDFPK